MAAADLCEARLDTPPWLGLLLVLPVWFFGPLIVSLVSLRVERQIEMNSS